jgi:VWFA-related protein
VFDTTHLSPGGLTRTRDAVVKFIADKFRQGDLGGIVADGRMANNRLTSDREELTQAAAAVKLTGDVRSRQMEAREWPRLRDEFEAFRIANNEREALDNAVQRACSEEPDQCRRAPADLQVIAKAKQLVITYQSATRLTLSVVETLSKGLARMAGPKTIVFLSEGFVLQQQESELRQAVGQAARAGAHFYTVDARGLNTGAGASIIDQANPDNPMGAPARFDMQADGANSLAVDTGGFAIRNENNFGRALDEIQRDAGTYYVVGYTPVKDTFDGKYREISVKVARPGVKVRARRGYLALAPAALLRPAPATAGAVSPKLPSDRSGATAEKADLLPTVPTSPGLRDVDKMVAALGRESASARLRPAGSGETRSAEAERGWGAYEQGDVEAAVRHLDEAAKAPDARPWVVYALGLSQFALRRYSDAAQSWERVRREVPEFEPIYFSLADAYGLQHEEGTALKVLREAEQRWPSDAEVSNAIGVLQIRRGALDAAIDSFDRATKIAPADALGFFNLGRALQMRLLKSQRYDQQTEKWIGGDEDRRRAIATFQKYLQLGGPYERLAREALSALGWS